MSNFTAHYLLDKFGQNLKKKLLRNVVFVDVGARIGEWTILGEKNNWTTIAIEACEASFTKLSQKYAGYSNIFLLNCAVSDANKDNIKFYTSEENSGTNSLSPEYHALNEDVYELVQMKTLESILEGYSLQADLIKIDIEGAELLALKGLNFNKHKPSMIVAEVSSRCLPFGYTTRDMVKFMRDMDYHAYIIITEKVEGKMIERFFCSYEESVNLKTPGCNRDAIFIQNDKLELFQSEL